MYWFGYLSPKPETSEQRLKKEREETPNCARCGEPSPMAAANCEDGKFRCYLCRTQRYRPGLKPWP